MPIPSRHVDIAGRVAAILQITSLDVCAPEGIRTPNLLIRSQMLYPLSYGRVLMNL